MLAPAIAPSDTSTRLPSGMLAIYWCFMLRLRRELAQDEALKDTLISVDTYHSTVARWAVDAGAHIVNDVSGGTLDPGMHAEVRP